MHTPKRSDMATRAEAKEQMIGEIKSVARIFARKQLSDKEAKSYPGSI